jgi:hypothetical protein
MSVSVIDYPVKIAGQNIFPGNSPLEVTFKREDLQITSIEQGAGNTIVINVPIDVTSSLNVGEYIFLNSFTLNVTAEVLEISTTQIRINSQWLFNNDDGYINYKQNYYLEIDTVSDVNVNIKILPFTLTDDGKANGEIIFDLSIINDLNPVNFPKFTGSTGLGGDTAIKFNIRYREQWRELNGGAYAFINNPMIITPAIILGEVEQFTNAFSEPQYYVGYPNGAVYLHSDSDPAGGEFYNFYYDELDLNKDSIRNNMPFGTFLSVNYGKIFALMYNLDLLEGTEYVQIRAEVGTLPEYNPEEYSEEYNIGQ